MNLATGHGESHKDVPGRLFHIATCIRSRADFPTECGNLPEKLGFPGGERVPRWLLCARVCVEGSESIRPYRGGGHPKNGYPLT